MSHRTSKNFHPALAKTEPVMSFGIVLEASLIFILEEKLVVLAVLEQQLFDTDYSFWNFLKVLSGSGQTARNFVFGFSGLATPISEESLSFGYLDQSQSTTIWNQNLSLVGETQTIHSLFCGEKDTSFHQKYNKF